MNFTFTNRMKISLQGERWWGRAHRSVLLIAVLFAFCITVRGQLTLQANLPAAGFIQKSQLWNILVINPSAAHYECKLHLSLTDRKTGQEMLTAVTGFFKISAGAVQLNEINLNPIQYNYISSGMDIRLQGLLPVGNYTACYTLTEASGKMELGENCFEFDVEPLSPPLLSFPSDSTQSDVQPLQFIWMPPTPAGMFSRLHYEILITQINDHQKADEALQQNIPFYNEGGLINNSLSYSGNHLSFERDKWYAWQVIARDDLSYAAKSETWVFKVNNSLDEKTSASPAPYLKMKKNGSDKGIAQNGILKLSYVNETTDSISLIRILGIPGERQRREFSAKLHAGENLIQYDLSKFKMKEGVIYEAQITNSRNELWSVLFEIHFYKTKSESNN